MAKRLVLLGCVAVSVMLFLLGMWTLFNHGHWLRTRQLDGVLMLLLFMLGVATVALTGQVRRGWAQFTAMDVLRYYGRFGGMLVIIAAAMVISLGLLRFLSGMFGHWPWLTLVAMLFALPLVLSSLDLVRGAVARRPRNLALGYISYALDSWYILLIQFIFVALLFVTGPLLLALSLITLFDGVARLVPKFNFTGDPILCHWADIGPPACMPGLALFFVFYGLLFWVVYRYHDQLLDFFAEHYRVAKNTVATLMGEDA